MRNLNSGLNSSRVVVDGVQFFRDKMEAIQKGMGFNLNGDVYTNVIEIYEGEDFEHFYSMVISPTRPNPLKTSTGMSGEWKKIQSPKFFNSYFHTMDAVTANVSDIDNTSRY